MCFSRSGLLIHAAQKSLIYRYQPLQPLFKKFQCRLYCCLSFIHEHQPLNMQHWSVNLLRSLSFSSERLSNCPIFICGFCSDTTFRTSLKKPFFYVFIRLNYYPNISPFWVQFCSSHYVKLCLAGCCL